MVLEQLQKRIEAVKERIEQAITHPYLCRYMNPRMIDEDRIAFSLSMLDAANIDRNIAEDYVFTMMLIQIALDTHDEVDEHEAMHLRQLTVLAGDLYSGLYYQFLANNHGMALIRLFAEAIKEINVQKIRLQRGNVDAIERFRCLGTIESALICKLAQYVNAENWSELAYYFFSLKRLNDENKKEKAVADYVEHCKRKLNDLLHSQPMHEDMKGRLYHLLDQST
jgi:heptaprenyl diphosphate synthase